VASDPAHVGRAPVDFARTVIEHALVGQRRIQQVATSGVLHALGLARGAGGIKDEQGFFGAHLFWRAVGRSHGHQIVVPDVAVLVPGDVAAGALEHDDFLHAGGVRVGQRHVDVGFDAVRLPPRTPSSAVITTFDLQSMMRPASASGEKPPNTTE
jgi:hypothetical protein